MEKDPVSPLLDLVFVSGLSGAGKSVALDMLEDLDYFCIDNLPLALAANLDPASLAGNDARYQRIAVGIDARASADDVRAFPEYLQQARARSSHSVRLLYLTASFDVLIRRFSETRRKHPLTGPDHDLGEALRSEQQLLDPVAQIADITLDTSDTNLHELRELIRTTLSPDNSPGLNLATVVRSFGFKHGAPKGLDLVFDVRCLPNPHWAPELRSGTGRDPAVQAWLRDQPEVMQMREDILHFLRRWIPHYAAQNRHYLTVGIGCTGGQHRSVFLAEEVALALGADFPMVSVRHTELP
nr:RNase adapter RapZ [Oceanococcus sp. HetDA_MAG_MS8]